MEDTCQSAENRRSGRNEVKMRLRILLGRKNVLAAGSQVVCVVPEICLHLTCVEIFCLCDRSNFKVVLCWLRSMVIWGFFTRSMLRIKNREHTRVIWSIWILVRMYAPVKLWIARMKQRRMWLWRRKRWPKTFYQSNPTLRVGRVYLECRTSCGFHFAVCSCQEGLPHQAMLPRK